MACDTCNFFFVLGYFLPSPLPPPHPPSPPNPNSQKKIQKISKNAWRYHHFDYHQLQLDDVWFLRYGM